MTTVLKPEYAARLAQGEPWEEAARGKAFDPALHPHDPHTGEFTETSGGSQTFESSQEAGAWAASHYGAWATEDVKQTMLAWGDTAGYKYMNQTLRRGSDYVQRSIDRRARGDESFHSYLNSERDHFVAKIADMREAIATAPPLERNTVVYRGMSAAILSKLDAGSTLTDKGFVATSLAREDAGAWKTSTAQGILEITLPKGTRAGWNGDWNYSQGTELVLPPDSSFRITGRDGDTVRAEYVKP